jgi:signal transduction histidine kinase/ligand-binding sensor domain-containing protein/CheY-like chemotaxis protein
MSRIMKNIIIFGDNKKFLKRNVLNNFICKYCYLIIFFSFFFIQTNAQDGNFKHLNIKDGLSQSWVRCIQQDTLGFMWFGTDNGLDRYDGNNFEIYKHNPSNPNSISSSRVNVLHEDKKGNLWVGTLNGLNLFNRENNFFEKQSNWPTATITSIAEDSDGNLWVGTFENLFLYNVSTKQIIEFKYNKEDSNSLSSRAIQKVLVDMSKNIWIGTTDGLNVLDPNHKVFKKYFHETNNPNSILSNDIRSLWLDKYSRLWIGSTKGIDILTNATWRPDKGNFIHIEHNNQNNASLSSGAILTMTETKDGKLYIGTENGGLNIFNLKQLDDEFYKFEHFVNDPENQNSLSNNSIYSIFQDNQENVWVGTHGDGLNILNKVNSNFELIQSRPGTKNTISNNQVNCFFEDKNNLWIGTEGGLNKYDKLSKKYYHYVNDPLNYATIAANSVMAINRDRRNKLWVGGMGSGLNLFYENTGTFGHFFADIDNKNGLRTNNIFSILVDKTGNIWLGLVCGSLAKFESNTGSFTYYQYGLGSNYDFECVKEVIETNDGNLWLIASNSLDCFNPQTEKFTRYTHNPTDKNSISSNWVFSLFEDYKFQLWVGTDAGLNLFNKSTNSFKNFQVEDGLPDNAIKSIIGDSKGNLWIGTDKGISKFINGVNNPEKRQFKNYTAEDGLQGNEFRKRACYKNADGKLYFGGINGYNAFYPDSIKENNYIPKVVFTDFLIFNKKAAVGKNAPLIKDISICKELTLIYSQSVITFKFSAISYISPQKNNYAYKMEGFDENWNYVGTKNEATYTNLEPGQYKFLVKASNNDGKWNETGSSILVNILPPWWKTWWARTILYISIVAIALYIYFLRISFYRHQQLKLTTLVKERTRELEEATAYLEEKQEEIHMQKEELIAQRNALEDSNTILVEHQEKINLQKNELVSQKGALEESNKLLTEKQEQIILQNKELDKHRYELESLIEERTRDLIDAKLKAEDSDRLKSAFLANMSHEIRTPMNAIIGFSSLLKDVEISSDEKEKMIDVIINNSESLLTIINDILDLSMIQSNQVKLYPVQTQIVTLLKEVQSSFMVECAKKSILLKLNLKEIDIDLTIDADKNRVKQVLVNLINNAIKFTNIGEIEIGISKNDAYITVYVKDTGIGIPEGTGNSIFERFLKIEDNTKLYGGTGLGLSICKSLVTLWGGDIWYKSVLNSGTTFYFTLPNTEIDGKTKAAPAKTEIKSLLLVDKIILIAEDQENNFLLLKVFLDKTKAKLIWAKNGREAIDYATNNNVDLVLMDIKMPDIDGLEAMKQIKTVNPRLPIIAQTAYAFENEKMEFIKQGFDGYLVKPLKIAEVFELIAKKLSIK